MSETITVPDFVDYPEFYTISENRHMFGQRFGYIIKPYNFDNVISWYVGFRSNFMVTRFADNKSNEINISKCDDSHPVKELAKHIDPVANLFHSARIIEALIYVDSDKLNVVDVMTSANKFLGPGMVRDLFEAITGTQEVIEITEFTDEVIDKNPGAYFKPSKFRYVLDGKNPRPQYGIIK
jgi:hypothetical protein